MQLQDATHAEVVNDVTSFVAEDDSGSFGIQAGHARMMASLSFGLARFRTLTGDWRYLALPGALLYFRDDTLTLSTRHYIIDDDYGRISVVLREKLLDEEAELRSVKESLHRIDEEALRRLWRLGQAGSRRDGL
ncbi:MAG: F0F1 ATP synthase subunit epsilon [Gammaproteobacteria bacterium]|jgi:F-type H+-transporting ATPase subunit epsilon